VERIVQTGKVFGVGFGIQSKHSVLSCGPKLKIIQDTAAERQALISGWTCPKYPAVPLSTSGI
jgi:hypothetical protein